MYESHTGPARVCPLCFGFSIVLEALVLILSFLLICVAVRISLLCLVADCILLLQRCLNNNFTFE